MPRLLGLILLLPVLELVAFVAVAGMIGLGKAVLLQLAISLIGFAMLGSLLTEAKARARTAGGFVSFALDSSRSMRGLAGLLFAIPGFVTDVIGVLALVPEVRARLRRLIGGAPPLRPQPAPASTRTARGDVLELDRGQWRETAEVPRRDA
ncbi:FxsA family protein [Hansschlegelia quercus]|uniref:FxsA family protein n=1 Tax=Hansschlegelia quercus TaxID=2528245 RepID=A0A4Q9GI08_9HYPH|nr:FxsA family protein [Hansschlegelia quercus]TBN53712.1 FxsA family protein [Hansschlegelia quercus]